MAGIEDFFPMPEFRPKQREVLLKCHELFESGKKLILLQAPVGFGKSAVNTALCRYYAPSLYTTPQLSLMDQIKNDEHLGKYFVEIKGRDHYTCAKMGFLVPVKYGLCKRQAKVINKICNPFVECPYYSQKFRAAFADIALMSTAYYIADAFLEPPLFGGRELVVIDEGHFLAEHVAEQVKLEVSSTSLPEEVWSRVTDPKDVETIAEMVKEYLTKVEERLEAGEVLSDAGVAEVVKAAEWLGKARFYIESKAEWVWTENTARLVRVRDMMPKIIWERGKRFVVSSATILDPEFWVAENGADLAFRLDEIAFIDVGSTFPPENRRVRDVSVGSMSYVDQKETLPRAARMLNYIAFMHRNENIAIHIPSYELAHQLGSLVSFNGREVYLPFPSNRDLMLEKWKKNGGILFAVGLEEGQDWKYGTCHVQVLAKTLYPDIKDPVVQKRLEEKEFRWYMWHALVRCLQAYGRAIRAPDDRMEFYVLDEKFWVLLKRMWRYVPDWFRQVVPENRLPR